MLVAATCAAVTNHYAGVLVTLAAGGTHHSAAVTDGGLVYTWGCASSGKWSFVSLRTSRFKKGFLPNTSKKIVTGQLGHHTSSVTPEDDLQKVVACMPYPQVVKMFKGEQTNSILDPRLKPPKPFNVFKGVTFQAFLVAIVTR